MKTLQDDWREYRDKVYPKGMSADQNRELHGAFFAGALCYLLQLDAMMDLNLNEEQVMGALSKLKREVWEINAGRAHVAKARN
jgi:hypothetical protein